MALLKPVVSSSPYFTVHIAVHPGKLRRACRALLCPRKGLSPPDPLVSVLAHLLSVRDADTEPGGKQPRKGGRHASTVFCAHARTSGQAEPRSASQAGEGAA